MTTKIILVCALALAGCGGATGTREPDEYTGCGTDEHWRTFDDQEPLVKADDTNSPQVTMPAAGATVPFATKVKLTWNQDANDAGKPDGDVLYMGPGCNNCCPQFNLGGLQALHLPPISGNVYDLQLSVGGKVVWRVITTLQEWGPDDSKGTWAMLRGKTVSVRVWRMDLLRNDPGSSGGPFVATQPFTFTVGS